MGEVCVVGAGIFGVTAALELRERGHRVTLVDAGPIPHPDASSTDISKVVRLDYGSDIFYTELMEEALPGWRALFGAGSEEPLFHESGFLLLSSEPLAPGSFEHDSHRLLTERGHRLERLDAEGIVRRFPAWRPDRYVDGYFNPQGGWAESGRVVAAYAERARRAGVRVVPGARLQALDRDLQMDEGTMRADCTVVACGAWTPILLPELADRLRPVAQPVVHFRPQQTRDFEAPRLSVWAADIARTGWYGFPLHAGVVKIANHGRGLARSPEAPRARPREVEPRFVDFARESMPALATAPIADSRLCFYCDSFDGDFLVARHPERPGVVVATGGSGHAFKFAPVLGSIVADVVEGAPNRWAARFEWRARPHAGREQARHAGS